MLVENSEDLASQTTATHMDHEKDHVNDLKKDVRDTERKEHHKIIVLNLTDKITTKHIEEIFSTFGTINYVDLVAPGKNNRSAVNLTAKAYVSYSTKDAADSAIKQMNGGVIDGVNITVSQLKPRVQDRGASRFNNDRYARRRSRSPRRNDRAVRRSRSPMSRRNNNRSPSPRRRRSPARRRSPSPRRRGDSPDRRSPVRRRSPSPRRRSPSPRRRASPRRSEQPPRRQRRSVSPRNNRDRSRSPARRPASPEGRR
ncbi:hypothetical protein BC833DRAFT_622224 [Globomyces pollinis-pini]|nr:hypothetical protein BC833DRAFT_622224 [Globomyces pollinis-pini]